MLEKQNLAFPLRSNRGGYSLKRETPVIFFILFYACSIYIFMNRIVVMTADSAAGDEKAGFSTQSVFILRGEWQHMYTQEEKIA